MGEGEGALEGLKPGNKVPITSDLPLRTLVQN